ncbi:MAG: hypothetical protein FWF92_07335 [Oscillospiraceae bacterium]|nr:hypothetical protein [Oscillospiraceae bacterium]
MTNNIKLLVVKNGAAYDMSNLVSNIKWSGRKGSSCRNLQVSFIDDDGYKHDRTDIDVEEGHQCVFYWKDKELFRGMFMKQEQSKKKTMSVTAYDNGIRLARNRDTFNYSNKKASEIFIDCCKRFGIPYDKIADTGYIIPELPKPKTTAWDVIADALSITYKATGIRYYPMCTGETINLTERRENILQWVIETGVNLIDYSQAKSIEKINTRIKLLSKEGTVLAEAADTALEKKIGTFQDIIQINDDMNSGQLTELVKTTLAENNKSMLSLPVTALGQPDVITGVGVFIKIDPLDISKAYYVEEDTHTFDRNYHSMSLKLEKATDISLPKAGIDISDKVQSDEENTITEASEVTVRYNIIKGGEDNIP